MTKRLILLILSLQTTFLLTAQTHFEGIIKENTTLTEKGSPYIVGKTIIIEGVVLTIEPGVELTVKFENVRTSASEHPNGFTLIVKGTIVAKGTREKPIQIEGAIDIRNPHILATSVFENCYLHHGFTDNVLTATSSVIMKNSTVEGGIYVTMTTNAGWNPRKIDLYQCKLSADYDALLLSFGSATINDCEIYGRCALYNLENLHITHTDFKQGAVKHPYGLLLDSRASVDYNTFEGFGGSAILVYYKPSNVVMMRYNAFRNNKNHIEIDVQTETTSYKDITKWDNFLDIEDNDFLNATENRILVTDNDHSSNRVQSYRNLDIKNNYWGKVLPETVAQAIHDNEDDDKIRVKLNFMPLKTLPYSTTRPDDTPKSKPAIIFTDTIDPLSILTFKFRDTTYDFHFRKIPKTEVAQWYNMMLSTTSDVYHYYGIQHQGRYYMNNYNVPAAFLPDYSRMLGYWALGFQNLDLDKVFFPFELKKTPTANEPYITVLFTNSRETITDFTAVLNSFEKGVLSGVIRGVYHNMNGYNEFIDARFSVRLELLPIKNH
jgi:hypothetical protein